MTLPTQGLCTERELPTTHPQLPAGHTTRGAWAVGSCLINLVSAPHVCPSCPNLHPLFQRHRCARMQRQNLAVDGVDGRVLSASACTSTACYRSRHNVHITKGILASPGERSCRPSDGRPRQLTDRPETRGALTSPAPRGSAKPLVLAVKPGSSALGGCEVCGQEKHRSHCHCQGRAWAQLLPRASCCNCGGARGQPRCQAEIPEPRPAR